MTQRAERWPPAKSEPHTKRDLDAPLRAMGSHWLLHVEVTRAGSLSKARPLRERQAVWTTGTRRVTCSGGVRPRGAPRSSDISTPAPWGGPPEVTREVRGHSQDSEHGWACGSTTHTGGTERAASCRVGPLTRPPAHRPAAVFLCYRFCGAVEPSQGQEDEGRGRRSRKRQRRHFSCSVRGRVCVCESMSLCVSLSEYVSMNVCVWVCASVGVCVRVCMSVSVSLSVWVSVYLWVRVCVNVYECECVYE